MRRVLVLVAAAALVSAGRSAIAAPPSLDAALQTLGAMRYGAQPQAAEAAALVERTADALAQSIEQRKAELDALPPARNDAAGRQAEQERRRLRMALAQAEFGFAELYRYALLAAPDHPDRADWYRAGLEHVGNLRVAYRDLAVSAMGRIAEARLHRAAGQTDQALAALKPLLDEPPKPNDPAGAVMYGLATIEQLRCRQVSEPAAAARDAMACLGVETFSDPAISAQLKWLAGESLARAILDGSLADTAADRAAEFIRDPDVVAAAPAFERLALIEALDERREARSTAPGGGRLMTPAERLDYADLLIQLGDAAGAERMYRIAMPNAEAPGARRWLNYAAMLQGAGDDLEAADAFDRYADALGPDDPRRTAALRWRNDALARAASDDPHAAGLVDRRSASLLELVRGEGDPAVRRQALREWVSLNGERLPPAELLDTLKAHRSLVEGDAYLRYALIVAGYRLVTDDGAAEVGDASTLRRFADELASVIDAAASADLPDVADRAALLRAGVLAASPLADRVSAVDQLQQRWSSLIGDAGTRDPAMALRIHLLLELGMVDAADRVVDQLPQGVSLSPDLLCRLADALAQRYDLAGSGRGMIQAQVIRQANRALELAVSDPSAYVSVAIRAADAMVRAEAYADALRIAERVRADRAADLTGEQRVSVGLLQSRAQLGLGRVDAALKTLDGLQQQVGPSAAIELARALALGRLGETEQALAAYRAARAAAEPGSDRWWRATLGLVRMVESQDQRPAALQIARAAAVLYPPTHSPALQAEVDQTLKRLEPSAASVPSTESRGNAS